MPWRRQSGSTAGSAGASSPEPADTSSAAIGAAGADALPAGAAADEVGQRPSFGARGRARRRARFLRKARELGYRDLGGLVFNLHRFGQRNDALVLAKLARSNASTASCARSRPRWQSASP